MPVPKKIIKFLEKAKVKYEPIEHRTVYTAYDKAQTLKVPEKIVGKTLVMKIDNSLALVLISANKNLDRNKFLQVVNKWLYSHGRIRIAGARRAKARYSHAEFASEKLIKNKLKGVKVGAIPPFGNLWGFQTFADKTLINQPKIIINGGNWQWSIKIKSGDFKKLIPDLAIGSFGKAKK